MSGFCYLRGGVLWSIFPELRKESLDEVVGDRTSRVGLKKEARSRGKRLRAQRENRENQSMRERSL